MDLPLLSELCGICHAEKPKYRCPRCKAQTCSLQCYKRHQQRASCSGKRNPAAYVRKSQWATPAGIDQDYNYLKGLERTIDDVSRNVRQRGNRVQPRKSKIAVRGWYRDSILQKYLTENRITVQHAPEGMSRQRNNDTRATKNGNVVWTIEWADGHGALATHNDFLASNSIGELHAEFQKRKFNAEKRRLNIEKSETNQRRSKRKRTQDRVDAEPASAEITRNDEQPLQHLEDDEPLPLANASGFEGDGARIVDSEKEVEFHDLEMHRVLLDDQSAGSSSQAQSDLQKDNIQDTIGNPPELDTNRPHDALPADLKSISENYYYLLKPGTAGPCHVLIPLDSETSLTTVLRDQVVQEYPTIYVLPEPPESLQAGFLLEEQYLRTTKEPNIWNACAVPTTIDKSSGSAGVGASGQINSATSKLDPSNILDMLKRDMML